MEVEVEPIFIVSVSFRTNLREVEIVSCLKDCCVIGRCVEERTLFLPPSSSLIQYSIACGVEN